MTSLFKYSMHKSQISSFQNGHLPAERSLPLRDFFKFSLDATHTVCEMVFIRVVVTGCWGCSLGGAVDPFHYAYLHKLYQSIQIHCVVKLMKFNGDLFSEVMTFLIANS